MNNVLMLLLKTPYYSYVYDANANTILRISDALFNDLLLFKNNDELTFTNSTTENEFYILRANGFLHESNIEKIENIYDDETLSYYLNNKIGMLTLQVTQSCNFRCSYCRYTLSDNTRSHSDKEMTWEVAKKAIDFFAARVRDTINVNVAFYGGEPLLRYDFIKKCIEYSKLQLEGKSLTFSLTTNASLLNEEMMNYFTINNVNILVSIDGPREINDYNRKFAKNGRGTFDVVFTNLSKLLTVNPDFSKSIGINAVIDPKCKYSDYEEFLTNEIFDNLNIMTPIVEAPSYQSIFFSKEFIEKQNYDKYLSLKTYAVSKNYSSISPMANQYIMMLQRTLDNLSSKARFSQVMSHGGPCIPGYKRLFVDINGIFYPCEKVSETIDCMKIGDLDNGFDLSSIKNMLNISSVTEDKCKKCWALRYCDICIRVAVDSKGINRDAILKQCNNIKYNIEQCFRDIIAINEVGEKAINKGVEIK